MKKKLLCILCCFFFFTHSFAPQARADTISVLKEILGWTVGDKLMEKCADWLGCDGYEQPSVGGTISGIVSTSNYKSQVCAVSGLLYNGGKIAGYALGGLLGLIVGNNIGQALECLYVWMKSGSAKKTAEKYHICLDERGQGHPLPYTDRQIAKLLDLMNKLPTVENIVDAYDKLCVRDDYGHYDFLTRGTVFDNVIIDHAPGYIYVLCASVYSACPCIYNLQHGTLEEPDYIKDENGAIVMENGELQMRNKETYQQRYAKHCRVMRFRDLYEQTNDLPNIFHFSCNDMVGYSKGKLPITAPIVQCIEGTARNIFEMPILGHTYITTYKENTIDYYKNDYTLVNNIVTDIENVIGVDKRGSIRRTQLDINLHLARDFTIPERIKIYHLLRDLWTKKNAVKIEYTVGAGGICISNGYRKYAFTQSNVTFLDKYFDNPSAHPMMFCCDNEFQTKVDNTSAYSCSGIPPVCRDPVKNDYSGVKVCERDDDITTDRNSSSPKKGKKFTDYFNGSLSKTFDKEDSQIDATTFTTTDIFEYYEEAKEFRDGLKEKYQTISKIYNAVDGAEFQEKNFVLEYTLFDIFRNRIKAVAGIFLVLWFFIIGWKFINGDTKLLKPDEFIKMFIKIALCWLIVFDDGVKNQLFRLVMQVAQGSVLATESVFGTIRDTKNNAVERACSFGNNVVYSAVLKDKGTGLLGSDDRCDVDFSACMPPAGKTLAESDLPGKCYGVVEGGKCHYYGLTCELNGVVQPKAFHCERHLVRDGVVTDVCLQGHCDANGVDFIPVPPFSRPYKYYERKDRTALSTGGIRLLKPKCCDSGSVGNKCENEEEPRQIYSQSLNQPVYVCRGGKKMSAGYKLADLITSGIIEDTDDEKRVFFQLYNEQIAPSPLLGKGSPLPASPNPPIEELIIPTSVANIDMNGRVVDLDFVDAKQGTDLYQRFQYSKYLVSKVNAANQKANYPHIIENGFWHNYAPIAFWDKLDCKIIQYLTFSMSGNGLDNTLADAVEHMKTGDDDALVGDLLNGLLQVAKFLILAFPFGVMAFCLFLALGVVMFMMLARATQKYCVCIFNLVLTIYLSPVVFIMYLFDATKKAMDTFINDIKANITGSITPFITLSLFLFVLDWLMFGDEDKYITEHMFSGDGVSSECYDGNESDAPIACLTRKLLDRFKLVAFFQMFIGRGPMVEGITWKMMWFLILRLLVALVVFLIMMTTCDAIESSIQGMIGEEPDTKIGVGFEGKAGEAYKSGIDAFKGSVSKTFGIYKGVGVGIYDAIKGIAGGGKGKAAQTGEKSGGNEHQQGFNDSSKNGSVSRGGLNDIGMDGANMNNMFGQGGGQGGQGSGLDNIGSQLSSMLDQVSKNAGLSKLGGNSVGRNGAQSGSGKGGGQSEYQQGYNKGFSDASSRGGGAGGNKSGEGQQGFTGSVKELFNNKSGKSVGSRLADVGKNAGNGIIKGVNSAMDGLVNYGEFVSDNMRRLRQEQEGQRLQEEQNNKKSDSKNEESGTNNNQSSGYEGTYGVGSGLLDDMRAQAMDNYISNKGANRSGVPKDSNDDGRNDKEKQSLSDKLFNLLSSNDSKSSRSNDKGKSKWNALTGRFNLSPSGSNKTSGPAGNAKGAAQNYENNMSNISKTQNITQKTNTSKETQVTHETVNGQDKVNVKETRVYIKGNNGNKNNNDN